MTKLKLSIKELCEFVYKSGSIDSRFFGFDRAALGARIHRILQKSGGDNYNSEVFLSYNIEFKNINYLISGRADGIFKTSENNYTIDEIKTTSISIESLKEVKFVNFKTNLLHYTLIANFF